MEKKSKKNKEIGRAGVLKRALGVGGLGDLSSEAFGRKSIPKDIFKRKILNDMMLGRGVSTEKDADIIGKTMSSMTPKGVVTKQDAKRLEKAFSLRRPVQYK